MTHDRNTVVGKALDEGNKLIGALDLDAVDTGFLDEANDSSYSGIERAKSGTERHVCNDKRRLWQVYMLEEASSVEEGCVETAFDRFAVVDDSI